MAVWCALLAVACAMPRFVGTCDEKQRERRGKPGDAAVPSPFVWSPLGARERDGARQGRTPRVFKKDTDTKKKKPCASLASDD